MELDHIQIRFKIWFKSWSKIFEKIKRIKFKVTKLLHSYYY